MRTGVSEMKVVEEKLTIVWKSGIFLIWAGRPIIINSVLEGLRLRLRVGWMTSIERFGLQQRVGGRLRWNKWPGRMI